MGRPVIGLTTYAEETRFGLQDTFAAVLPLAYVHAVHASGGRAVLITPDDPDVDILDRIDGDRLRRWVRCGPRASTAQAAAPDDVGRARSGTRPRCCCCARRWTATCRCSASAGACS